MSSRKPLLAIIFLTIVIDMIGMGILIPTFPMLISPSSPHRILPEGWTDAQGFIMGGWLLASYPLMQFFFTPILGQLSDRIGRKKVLAFSILGTSISYLVFAYGILTHNIPLLFFSRILDGASGGNISVAQAVIGDISAPEHRARNFGLVGVALGLGFILGPVIGGLLSDPSIHAGFSLTTPFYFAAGLALLNGLFMLTFLPETNTQRNPEPMHWARSLTNMSKVFTVPELRSTVPAVFLFNGGFTFFTTFWGVVLAEEFLYKQKDIGHFFGFMGIMIVLAQGGLVRRLSGKVTDYKVLRFSIFASGLCLAPYFFIPGNMPGLIYVIPPFLAVAMALTKSFSVALLTRITHPTIRGEVMGINSSANALAQVFPAVLAGYIAASDARMPILVGTTTVLVGGAYFIGMYRERQ
jgi:MFS transporter, DHA1 family, tetracycline resistance protein